MFTIERSFEAVRESLERTHGVGPGLVAAGAPRRVRGAAGGRRGQPAQRPQGCVYQRPRGLGGIRILEGSVLGCIEADFCN